MDRLPLLEILFATIYILREAYSSHNNPCSQQSLLEPNALYVREAKILSFLPFSLNRLLITQPLC